MYPREMKTYFQTENLTQLFMETLFITIKRWKVSKCHSMGEWTHKVLYIHTMLYYSAIKMSEQLIHETT